MDEDILIRLPLFPCDDPKAHPWRKLLGDTFWQHLGDKSLGDRLLGSIVGQVWVGVMPLANELEDILIYQISDDAFGLPRYRL